ncbi:hypothetical protein L9G74_01665 [Shewanella sp. C32]|uniref:Uncharacterized protein n=1 Tax=Shewanella electrica TaxID=515560 RepID=A0ABT2FIU8_9GAMM|nr:hypothetical protein [Shewanella electrica]MCH1925311.1 hypothetical protein [Shewanella electrica]MCS4555136.1 hypothetical protein [Shewanella electrica]
MTQRQTPQQKKVLDYVNHSKNSYGENDKSSRKAIRSRKAQVNRQFRREQTQLLQQYDDADELSAALQAQPRLNWKKAADAPLIAHIAKRAKPVLKPMSEAQHQALLKLRKQARPQSS